MHPEGNRTAEREEATRSTDPLVYTLEGIEETCSSGVPYERAIQIARLDLGVSRSEAVECIEGRIEDGRLERVDADRLGTR
jgi:hypothetical protein